MPDLLVLTRNYKNGDLKMVMEIDPEPRVFDPNEFKNLPVPNISKNHKTRNDWIKSHHEGVDWLQGQVRDFLSTHDWGLDVTAEINWSNLMRDLEDYAYNTMKR